LSKHKNNKGDKRPGWDFVPNADDWAELDAMNEQADREADAMARSGT
jgi:RNA-binding protein NOB1